MDKFYVTKVARKMAKPSGPPFLHRMHYALSQLHFLLPMLFHVVPHELPDCLTGCCVLLLASRAECFLEVFAYSGSDVGFVFHDATLWLLCSYSVALLCRLSIMVG